MRSEAGVAEWKKWKRDNPDRVDSMRNYVRRYCDGCLKEDPGWVPNHGSQLVRFLKDLDIDDEYIKLQPHSWVTVRVDKSETIESVYEKLIRLEYTWLTGGEVVLEDFHSHNPHFHLLLPRKMHKGNIIKILSNRFKVPKPAVDYEQSDCPDRYGQRKKYIRGMKQDKKADKVAADVEFRNAHNIPHLITF